MKPRDPSPGPFLIPGATHHDCKSQACDAGHDFPCAGGFVRHRQPRQAEGDTIGTDLADLAIKAATQLQLRVLASNDPKIGESAARCQLAGFTRLAERSCRSFPATCTTSWSQPPPNGNAHRASPPASGRSGGSGSAAGGSPPNLPKTWQEISLGDLVVAHEGPEDGWYEAIVAEVNGDMLTLRWRDYGFRPKRGQHDALDALAVGISTKRVNFILDADVASFFDSVSKEKLVRFVEHRVGDPRIIRLIQKWLKAGVLEDGVVRSVKAGRGRVR